MLKEPKIDKSKLFEQCDYKPHSDEQWAAHNSGARFRIPCCGRRWGKSTFAAMEFTWKLFIPDTYWWIVGPTYTLGEKEFRIIYRNLMNKLEMRKMIRATYNPKQGDMRIEMPWNTVLEVKSADRKDTLVGEGLDGVILSEAALHDLATWEQYIEPALSDKRGEAIFPSTPRGYNWFQGMWQLGQDPSMPLYESWRFPTWTNTAMFPGGRDDPEIKRIEAQVSKAYFDQEYAAEFTTFVGQIYDEFDYTTHVTDIPYNPEWRNYLALDFGYKDPFVALDIMVDPMDRAYVWREYQVSGLSTWEHGHKLLGRENPPGYHIDNIFADPRGADEIATLQILLGYIMAPSVPWIQGIEAIKRLMKFQADGTVMFKIDRSCVESIRQLEQLHHKEVKEGKNVRIEGQHDYDDHGPDALRYFAGPYYVLGANSHLADVYDPAHSRSEAATFFQLHKGFTRESGFTPF